MRTLKIALLAALLPAAAAAQTQLPAMPPGSVLGVMTGGSARAPTAIPFATLSSKLTGAAITLNSGNGQTAPGAMSGGNTYLFGATTDTVQFTGVGLGGTPPATGLKVFNAPVNPGGAGQGSVGASSTNGGGLIGQGSVYDAFLGNQAGAVAAGVATNTQNMVFLGSITAAALQTSGTIGGSVCMTSAGIMLYKAGVNCFAVSGITVVSGKTLTVDNTLELAGTDGTKMTFPGANDTVAGLGANQTFTGTDIFSGTLNITGTGQINGTAFGTFATQNFATPPAIGGTTPAAGTFSTLTATTPIGLSSGGTNAGTAAGARASGGLNVDGYTPKGDTNYTMVAADRTVGTSTSLTAPRTWTLPAASAVNAGQELVVVDMVGGVTNTNTLTVARAGSDTINGSTSVTINVSNGGYLFRSDGVSKWTAQQLGAQATVGVSSINGQTGNPSIVAGTAISVSTSGSNIQVNNTATVNGLSGTVVTGLAAPGGRLTTSSGVCVPTTDVTAATSIFYAPCVNPYVPINNGTNVQAYNFTSGVTDTVGLTLTLGSNWIANTLFDVYITLNSGSPVLCTAPWASSSAGTSSRNFAIGLYGGFLTNGVAIAACRISNSTTIALAQNQGTYVGTFLTNGSTGQIDFKFGSSAAGGGAAVAGVWNMYNRTPGAFWVNDSTVNFGTSATSTFQPLDVGGTGAGLNNRITFVTGTGSDPIDASLLLGGQPSSGTMQAGIGINTTSGFSARCGGWLTGNSAAGIVMTAPCKAYGSVGLNYAQAIMWATSTSSPFISGPNGGLFATWWW